MRHMQMKLWIVLAMAALALILFDHFFWAHIRFPNPGAIHIRVHALSADTAGRADRALSCDAGE